VDIVAKVVCDALSAPETCEEETTEYQNRIENLEIDPEEEVEDSESKEFSEEAERQFARYERSFRARRIRELTRAPIVVKRKRGRPPKVAERRAA
jgi:hypothetical protein